MISTFESVLSLEHTLIGSRTDSSVPVADSPSAKLLGKLLDKSNVVIAISPVEVSNVNSCGSGELTVHMSLVVIAVKGS